MSEWISVKERLPDIETWVLVHCVNGKITSDLRIAPFGKFMISPVYGEVTHWMPLPEPPEEAEK